MSKEKSANFVIITSGIFPFYSSTVICSQGDRPKTTDAHAYASTYTLISKPGVRSLPDGTLFLTNWRIIPILFNYPKIFCTDISNCNMC